MIASDWREHPALVLERGHALLRIHLVVGLAVLLAAIAHEVHGNRAVRNTLV